MNRIQLTTRSLIHYWRTNLAVTLGVIAGTAVISGAMIVGDSVRASLQQMTLNRLGKVDYALSGPRFFREEMAKRFQSVATENRFLEKNEMAQVAPVIVMQAGLQAKSGSQFRRAGKVNVYGVDARAWPLFKSEGIAPPLETGVVLNSRTAEAIDAKVGDEITAWIELPSSIPRDTLMGKKDNDSQEITLKVIEVVGDSSGLSRFGLQPTQSLPRNAFVNLRVLQERLGLEDVRPSRRDPVGKPARVNSLLINPGVSTKTVSVPPISELSGLIRKSWSLSDLNLRIIDSKQFQGFVFESEQMMLEDSVSRVVVKSAQEMGLSTSPIMVYLANKIWNPKVHDANAKAGYSMYSTVAGLDLLALDGTPFAGFEFVGDHPASFVENDVVLNEFLAQDLAVNVGDQIRFKYHTMGSRGELPELEQAVTVRGIVKMSGAAIDRSMIPEVKGITDVESLSDWDQPFPMDLGSVTLRDDEYWESYRATPKMYLPLKTAQSLWPSRYGSLTSVRIAPKERTTESSDIIQLSSIKNQFVTRILSELDPQDVGLAMLPVKAMGLRAASGSTDFSGLFFGFSMFLIVAAMILIGLLFRLGIEQRVRQLGLLGAVGFNARQVRNQMLREGLVMSVSGSLCGTVIAIVYAFAMIYGLTHWWVGAVGTRSLSINVRFVTLAVGGLFATLAAIGSIWWALRQFRKLSIREQLAGVVEQEVDINRQLKKAHRSRRLSQGCLLVAFVLMSGSVAGGIPAPAAFFGSGILLLSGSLLLLSAWLQSECGIGVGGRGIAALGRLGLRNASRQRQRTIMSAGMIAVATFLIVAVAAFRRDPTGELPDKKSGNGGYSLVAESSSPILYDLNTIEGRKKLQLTAPINSAAARALESMNVAPFRVKPGEDASCLNLYQTRLPTILGVPRSMIEEGRFAFASGSWSDLLPRSNDGASASSDADPIPVLGDMNTLMFSLHKQVGDTIGIPNEEAPRQRLIVKGMFQDSVFQGVLVTSEESFLKLFPDQKGFQYFLIEVPPAEAHDASTLLESELAEYGLDVEPVAERLARFLSVQNTYLSTFQTLGGLGLLLGTFGLATVMLRNVLERQSEIALLRAVGYRERSVAALVLCETAFVLVWGLAAGTGSAILATAPNLLSRGSDLPWSSLGELLTMVFITGILSALFAVRASVRLPIVITLRGE